MSRVVCLRGREEELGALRDRLAEELGPSAVLVAAFASPKVNLLTTLSALEDRLPNAQVIGSTTAGEFTEEGDGSGTVALFGLAGDYKVFAGVGTGLARDPESAVRGALAGQPNEVYGYPYRTGIVLLDPLAGHGEEAALLLATSLGDAPLVGGAAGDDLAMTKTWVGAGAKVASDALAVATVFSKRPLGIGVKHGHTPLSKPLRVTRAEGSVVLEIDGRPAWDVWLAETGERARALGLDPGGNPGAYLLRFEAGLRAAGEFKVRAPLAPKDKGILFATALPEGSVFQIMESDVSSQVDSAVVAAHRAREGLGGGAVAGALVFDCICRKLILQDDYAGMLREVSAELGHTPLAGFATYGEIAMNSGDMSGFHNTTTVVLAFPVDEQR